MADSCFPLCLKKLGKCFIRGCDHCSSSSASTAKCLWRKARRRFPSSVGIQPTPEHSGHSIICPWSSTGMTPLPQQVQHLTSSSGSPMVSNSQKEDGQACRCPVSRADQFPCQNSAWPGALGKGITSRMLPSPVTNCTILSSPSPKPEWGTDPNCLNSMYQW